MFNKLRDMVPNQNIQTYESIKDEEKELTALLLAEYASPPLQIPKPQPATGYPYLYDQNDDLEARLNALK